MGRLVLYMSMSLDGFIAGPGDGMDNPFGTGGHRLHGWLGDGGAGVSGYRPGDPAGQTVFDELMRPVPCSPAAHRRVHRLLGRRPTPACRSSSPRTRHRRARPRPACAS